MFLKFYQGKLIYRAVLVPGVYQSESVVDIYVYLLFLDSFPI